MKKDLTTAAIGGGIGGLCDAIYATTMWGLGAWQGVASGLLGKASFDGGNSTIALGLVLHFFIAFVMALVYVKASHRLPILTSRPLLIGVLYGLVLYVVMNFVVVPLSAIGFRPPTLMGVVKSLPPHILFVGPAIALVTAWRARGTTLGLKTGSMPTS
jgi:hypothetical protein